MVFHRFVDLTEVEKEARCYPRSVYECPNGNKYKKLLFVDTNSLYPLTFTQELPCGPGLLFKKENNTFKMQSLYDSEKRTSAEALDYLEWENSRLEKYYGVEMQHALRHGEKKINGYSIDGYAEIKSADGSVFKMGWEYYGCYYHYCSYCKIETIQTKEDVLKDFRRREALEAGLDRLVVARSCKWKALKYKINFKSSLSPFLREPAITTAMILNAVREKQFFGIIKVSIETPQSVIDKLKHLNFPVIFRKQMVSEDMVNSEMLRMAKELKREFPYSVMTLCWHAESIILCTPLLSFYMDLGMRVKNVEYAIQYIPAKPFKPFIDSLVKMRIESVGTNAPLGDRCKFTMNSSIAFGLKTRVNK